MYMHKNFLNAILEFARGVEEDRDLFMQMTLKVCKTFKMKSLKTPRLDVPSKKHTLFYTKIGKRKKELKGALVSQASVIMSRKWKKFKACDKKIKKFSAETQRYEEAQQRYQEDHMDEVELISLQKVQ